MSPVEGHEALYSLRPKRRYNNAVSSTAPDGSLVRSRSVGSHSCSLSCNNYVVKSLRLQLQDPTSCSSAKGLCSRIDFSAAERDKSGPPELADERHLLTIRPRNGGDQRGVWTIISSNWPYATN
ncbi:unnamed protein product [Protopolystoma xenopodis]|uniref:Uncharacterized protein n=1 Tax=Protopolystoma xenopodis TaxID=117903 RepID=A0A448WZP8_9PLAT|nr:unnamed protein product [Protopolystoma xenopodis]